MNIRDIAQPARDMVRHIYYLLFVLINKEQHQHVTFRPVFMKRESCQRTPPFRNRAVQIKHFAS